MATGGNLAIVAGHDVNATAAYANAQGAIGVSAGHDVNLNAGEQSASANDEHYRKENGFLSSKSTHTIDSSSYTNAVGTTLSGSTVAVQAGNDLTAKAATIAATNDVSLSAGHDLNVLAGGAGALVGGGTGALSGASVDRFNRQLHPDEKKAIHDKANGDKALEKRSTRAAFNANFVSLVEAENLKSEIGWVKGQQDKGLFVYTDGQKYFDNVKANLIAPGKDAIKVVTGGIATTTGLGICGVGGPVCIVGGPMTAMGASDFTEGASGLYNFYMGRGAAGYNPLRETFSSISPKWGGTAYDVVNFGVSVGGLFAPRTLNVGLADGLGRPQSMFGVTVPAYNNVKLLPLTKMPLPGVNQPLMLFVIGSRGVAVYNDVSKEAKPSRP
ncbi:hemagglutinin repeat-containing protein [Burkholderia diffusa]|uniref:hemagglutinin repeat-containing protein n=1 Tax=Burkholderia diffusa TaxID=488732 RepID=UPI002AB07EC6|nr:hemagglutinin repeat-containing protein [Burkholderia diffusa]